MAYSEKKFREDIERFERWIRRRAAALAGEAKTKRVWVEPTRVSAHTRAGHYRVTIRMPEKKRKRR